MQAYVRDIMDSEVSVADFRKYNRTPTSATVKPDYATVLGQSESAGGDAMARVTEEALTGKLSYSFRKAALGAMTPEARESAAQLNRSAQTGKFISE